MKPIPTRVFLILLTTTNALLVPTLTLAKSPTRGKSVELLCGDKSKTYSFVVDATGNVSDTGRAVEGPACIQVYFPGVQYKASLSQATTTSKGPDASSVVMGTAGTSGGGSEKLTVQPSKIQQNVGNRFAKLKETEADLRSRLTQAKNRYSSAMDDQEKAIAAIKAILQSEIGTDPAQMQGAVKEGYRILKPVLAAALNDEGSFVPSDRADSQGITVLPALQAVGTELALFKVTFADGVDKADAANPPKCTPDLSNAPETRNIAFADWYSHCKDAYDALTQQINTDIQDAQAYISSSDKVGQLKSKLAIVKYWDLHFSEIGLRRTMTDPQINDADISAAFSTAIPVRCGTLFNMNSSTAVSVVTIDQTPTLEGNNPTVNTQPSFVTVTCASPLSVSAGVAFSTIEQKEFAIIKSSGGTNNTSVNKFGTINDSRLHPMPIGLVHLRLADWGNHKYAFHASFGVSGNIKGQDSGGSAAEFLPGVAFSFWRTMFLTLGPHIGTKAELAGGFKEGDLVPSDITSIQGQVKRSYTVGFGFAITFTKP
jgi:hypothetical protein